MIHIVFNELDVKILESAIDLDETLQGNIVQIKDDYSVGPIHDIYDLISEFDFKFKKKTS